MTEDERKTDRMMTEDDGRMGRPDGRLTEDWRKTDEDRQKIHRMWQKTDGMMTEE